MKSIFKRKNKKAIQQTNPENIEISSPFDVKLEVHVDFDTEFGLSGIPKEWANKIQGLNYTVNDLNDNDGDKTEQGLLDSDISKQKINQSFHVTNTSNSSNELDNSLIDQQFHSFSNIQQVLDIQNLDQKTRRSTILNLYRKGRAPLSPVSSSSSLNNNMHHSFNNNGSNTPQSETKSDPSSPNAPSLFSKFFKNKNKNEEEQKFGFTLMKKSETGYFIESDAKTSNETIANIKFKKDKLLIDLISSENPFRLFTKMKKIGTGSTADVYKAIHVPSGKKVAIKVMPFTSNKNTNFDMVENEIFMIYHACRNYENIFEYDSKIDKTLMVQYFETFSTVNCELHDHINRYISDKAKKRKQNKLKEEQDMSSYQLLKNNNLNNLNIMVDHQKKSNDELWVVMEYVSGGKLTDLLHVKFMESEIAAILTPILKALYLLHTKYGVIHRDIKSDNILITRDGKIKLADFGFCAENNKKRRSVVGTPFWMSPEIVMANPYDEKTDVWSFGILCLELANGEVPLIEHPPIKALFLIRSQDPPTFKNPSDWSDTFKDFLSKCLQKDPTQRASVAELLEHPFIKSACSLDFLGPVLERIRLEKRKVNEEDIGLQVIKLRNSTDEDDNEDENKKKKGVSGIMGVISMKSEEEEENVINEENDVAAYYDDDDALI